MMVYLTKILGLSPKSPKTGAREAANFAFLVSAIFTGIILWISIQYGHEYLAAGVPFIITTWVSSLGLFAYAYKLKSEKLNETKLPESNPSFGGESYVDEYEDEPQAQPQPVPGNI